MGDIHRECPVSGGVLFRQLVTNRLVARIGSYLVQVRVGVHPLGVFVAEVHRLVEYHLVRLTGKECGLRLWQKFPNHWM